MTTEQAAEKINGAYQVGGFAVQGILLTILEEFEQSISERVWSEALKESVKCVGKVFDDECESCCLECRQLELEDTIKSIESIKNPYITETPTEAGQ